MGLFKQGKEGSLALARQVFPAAAAQHLRWGWLCAREGVQGQAAPQAI